MPNLAFRSLALAIKALTEHWEQAHGYKRALVAVERTTTFDQDEEPTIAFDITSHPPRRTAPAALQNWPAATWGGSGSRHHWVRDASMREDKTRSKDDNLNCHLSALRVCRVALKADLHPEPSWPQFHVGELGVFLGHVADGVRVHRVASHGHEQFVGRFAGDKLRAHAFDVGLRKFRRRVRSGGFNLGAGDRRGVRGR